MPDSQSEMTDSQPADRTARQAVAVSLKDSDGSPRRVLSVTVGAKPLVRGTNTRRRRVAILLFEVAQVTGPISFERLSPMLARYSAWTSIEDARHATKGRVSLKAESAKKIYAKYMRSLEKRGVVRRAVGDEDLKRKPEVWERVAPIEIDGDAAEYIRALRAVVVYAPPAQSPLHADEGVRLYLASVGGNIDRVAIDGAFDLDSSRDGWLESEIGEEFVGGVERSHFAPWIEAWRASEPDPGDNWEKYCVVGYVPPPTADHRRGGPRFRIGVSDWYHVQGQRYANGFEPNPRVHGRRFSDDGIFVGSGGTRYGLEFNLHGADPRTESSANDRVLYATCSTVVVESSDGQLLLFRRGLPRRGGDAPVAFAAGTWSATIEEQPRHLDLPEHCDARVGHKTSLLFNAAFRGIGEELLDYAPQEASILARRDVASIVMLSAFFEPAPCYVEALFRAKLKLSAEEIAARWRSADQERAEGVSLWWAKPSEDLLKALLSHADFDPGLFAGVGELRSRELIVENRGAWHPTARFRLWRYARSREYSVPDPK